MITLQETNMNLKDKELFLKDLCARLPYGVKVDCKWKTPAPNNTYGMICTLDSFLLDQIYNVDDVDVPFDEFKPYLFPLSSMTEEQKRELKDLLSQETKILIEQFKNNDCGIDEGKYHFIKDLELDWLLENHFDFRGLIPKNLANDATGLNIY